MLSIDRYTSFWKCTCHKAKGKPINQTWIYKTWHF